MGGPGIFRPKQDKTAGFPAAYLPRILLRQQRGPRPMARSSGDAVPAYFIIAQSRNDGTVHPSALRRPPRQAFDCDVKYYSIFLLEKTEGLRYNKQETGSAGNSMK